jgi:radical SAM superfamily enzyme YgiQ (UPF0313 family)
MSMPDAHPYFQSLTMAGPNLALSSIAGNLEGSHNVGIGDLILKRKNIRRAVLQALKKTQPDIVGLSAMSFQYDTAIRIARFIKNKDPSIKIALGGYHATLMFDEITKSKEAKYIDFIFRGESDLSFNEMINSYEKGRDLASIEGLSFKKGKRFIHNRSRQLEDIKNI